MAANDFSGEELTERERKALRKILRDQDRVDWFWATMRIWGGWVSATIIGGYATYEAITKFLLRAKGGP